MCFIFDRYCPHNSSVHYLISDILLDQSASDISMAANMPVDRLSSGKVKYMLNTRQLPRLVSDSVFVFAFFLAA